MELYGIGQKETDEFDRRLLLARRLAEQGVRIGSHETGSDCARPTVRLVEEGHGPITAVLG